MAIKLGRNFGKELCEALGIDPSRIRSVALRADAGDAVIVTVERFVTDDEAGKVVRLIEEHRKAS